MNPSFSKTSSKEAVLIVFYTYEEKIVLDRTKLLFSILSPLSILLSCSLFYYPVFMITQCIFVLTMVWIEHTPIWARKLEITCWVFFFSPIKYFYALNKWKQITTKISESPMTLKIVCCPSSSYNTQTLQMIKIFGETPTVFFLCKIKNTLPLCYSAYLISLFKLIVARRPFPK